MATQPDTTDLCDFLRTTWLGKALDDETLRELAIESRARDVAAGQRVIGRGESHGYVGIVRAGRLRASAEVLGQGSGEEIPLPMTVGPGDLFGLRTLVYPGPSPIDVVAEVASTWIEIPVGSLRGAIIRGDGEAGGASDQIARLVIESESRFASVTAPAMTLANDQPIVNPGQKLLVINGGSSSLKYRLFDGDGGPGVHGVIERIGIAGTRSVHHGPRGESTRELPTGSYADAFDAMVAALADPQYGTIRDAGQIVVVGHRVVHGGDLFRQPVEVDAAVLAQIESLAPLAPLHNPVNAAGIREAMRVFPSAKQVAVFDTSFHQTMPSHASLYGLPIEYARSHQLRRYGFHGISHAYVSREAARYLGRPLEGMKLVSCHLGNGASVCAIDAGRSIDTSMGFTPGEGLVMGTRCGDLDAAAVLHMQRRLGMGVEEIERLLNKGSGLLGLSGLSADMRDLQRAADAGDAAAQNAIRVFCYRVRKYIGAFWTALGGLDVLVFTAGIGQGSATVRSLSLQGLAGLGIRIDEAKNLAARGFEEVCRVSTDDSQVTVLVVPTDEERMIAAESSRTLGRSKITAALEGRAAVPFPIEVSAHHIHLSQPDIERLFGFGHQLVHRRDLSQPGQYACEETVALVGPKGSIERVRVLGPPRESTQIEIAMTEQFKLGIYPPVRDSGDLEGTPGCRVQGPAGCVTIGRGVICARRHVHMSPADALRLGVRDGDTVRLRVTGDGEHQLSDVLVRVDDRFALAAHIDVDEARAAGIAKSGWGVIEAIETAG